MKPLISVVSASWNQGRYLEECHQSIKGCEEGLVEHIVVDNCSDDVTHEVLKKYPEIIAVIEPDRGQSEALNKGFRRARGEWILWLNVDDFLLPGVIEKMLEIVRSGDGDFDLLYGHTVFVDAESKPIRTVFQPVWHYWMTAIGCYAAPSTGSLYRRRMLVENPLDENFHMIMDTEWMLRVGRELRAFRLNTETVAFRLAENKTADHINSGLLTQRHQEERICLAEKFPAYGKAGENRKGAGYNLVISIFRKLTRATILLDKAISKYVLSQK